MSGFEISCFSALCRVRPPWGPAEDQDMRGRESDNIQPSIPFLTLARVLEFSASPSCHCACPVLQNHSWLHLSAGPQQMWSLPSPFPPAVLRTNSCGYIPWCFRRPSLGPWPSYDSVTVLTFNLHQLNHFECAICFFLGPDWCSKYDLL